MGMADDAEIRRANFKRLWPEKFSPSQAAAALWGTPQQWSDVYYGRKSFGEKLARSIEEKMQLVRLSLDDPEGPKSSALSHEVLEALAKASPDQRAMVESLIRTYLQMPQATEVSQKRNRAA